MSWDRSWNWVLAPVDERVGDELEGDGEGGDDDGDPEEPQEPALRRGDVDEAVDGRRFQELLEHLHALLGPSQKEWVT